MHPFYVLSAFVLGAGHALEPGHGKTIVGAYLIGSRGRAIDAVLLGVIVTLTHTAGVLALGVVALFASSYYRPQEINRFLQLPAALLVLGVGVLLLRDAWRMFRRRSDQVSELAHGHQHGHDHGSRKHVHGHEGLELAVHDHGDGAPGNGAAPSLGMLVTLGISGGLIPCPTALALLLAAIGEGQAAAGLIYVIVFSLGLTTVLVAIGLAMVSAASFAASRLPGAGLARWARLLSGVLVTAIGVYLVIEAITMQNWALP